MATAPVNCRPRLWKRFVDDTLEVIKRGSVTQLTEHLNSVDSTGSIRFTAYFNMYTSLITDVG